MYVGVNMGSSLREKYREMCEADFPLPLAVVDTEKERLIFEKDEEVHFSHSLLRSFTHLKKLITTRLFALSFL